MTLTRRPWKPGAGSSIRPRRGDSKRLADPVSDSAYRAVMVRAGHSCEASRDIPCRGRLHWHHRKPVSQGGTSSVCNGMALCDRHHSWAHGHPTLALALGWLVDRREDPMAVTVLVHGGKRVTFLPDGTYGEVA